VRPSGSARPRGTGPRREDAKAPAGRRGIGRGLLGATIGEITVTDEQKKALEAALGSLPAAHDRNHANGLAKQLRAGSSIDPAAVGADPAARKKKLVQAVQTVHDTLKPEQRTELLKKLDESIAKRAAARSRDRGDLMFVLRGIEVSEEQKEKITKALAAAGIAPPNDATLKAAMAAFGAEPFDAEKAVPILGIPPDVVAAMQVVAPILDADQRTKLADKLDSPGRGARQGGK